MLSISEKKVLERKAGPIWSSSGLLGKTLVFQKFAKAWLLLQRPDQFSQVFFHTHERFAPLGMSYKQTKKN